ncbi:MAG: hypothetical protein WA678_07760 [Rhabdochlamydiaceae bacterium]|jgi:hypothetical protein
MKTQHEIVKTQQEVVRGADAPEPFLEWKYELNEETGKHKFKSIGLSDGSKIDTDNLKGALKRATGANDVAVGEKILNKVARGMTGERADLRVNEVSALLPALRPKDETEAMLLGQFIALQDSGMKCLRHANLPEQGFYHEEKLFLLANKLLSTANQTMQTVLKYRSGGQQIVQVLHVHNEGQAIVAQNLSSQPRREGPKEKTEN